MQGDPGSLPLDSPGSPPLPCPLKPPRPGQAGITGQAESTSFQWTEPLAEERCPRLQARAWKGNVTAQAEPLPEAQARAEALHLQRVGFHLRLYRLHLAGQGELLEAPEGRLESWPPHRSAPQKPESHLRPGVGAPAEGHGLSRGRQKLCSRCWAVWESKSIISSVV